MTKQKRMNSIDSFKVFHIFFIMAAGAMLVIGLKTILQPYQEKSRRVEYEEDIADAYIAGLLNETFDVKDTGGIAAGDTPVADNEVGISYDYSDVDSNAYRGYIDSVIVCDKINMKKLVIRGDNDFNLERYYFVTADSTIQLNEGNYIIYGHNSRLYGHSFNRLNELEIGDEFTMLKEGGQYKYQIEAKDRALRSESAPYLLDQEKTVTLISCESNIQPGYNEKRVIIVRAFLVEDEKYVVE